MTATNLTANEGRMTTRQPGPAAGASSTRRIVTNEVAKLRHLRTGLVVAALVLGAVVLTLASTVTSAEFADPARRSWTVPLAGLSLAVPLVSPLLIAVLASRMVDMEHTGQGWLANETAGVTPGTLCRAKWAVGAAMITAATAVTHLLVWALGSILGISAEVPGSLWLGFAASGLVINLVVLALHVLLSAKVDNQLVTLGIAVVGTVVAVFAAGLPGWFAHASPWGYYSLIAAAHYADGELVINTPAYVSVAALAAVAAVVFLLVTRRFDRQEA